MIATSWMAPIQGVWDFWGQYLHKDGFWGGRIHYILGMDSKISNERGLVWGTGLDAMVFPSGQQTWSYFTGIGIRFGQERQTFDFECVQTPCPEVQVEEGGYWGVYGLSGIIYTPFKYVGISGSFGLGYRSRSIAINQLALIAELSVAFRLYTP